MCKHRRKIPKTVNNKLIKILLVDDDEEDFIITKNIVSKIRGREYSLKWTSSFEEAMNSIYNSLYDVFLIDYRLGAHSGLELIKNAVENGCSHPLILLTGQGDIEIDEKAMKAGASDYLVKGTFNAEQLDRSIRYSIEHALNIQEIKKLNSELEERVKNRTSELEETNNYLQGVLEERKEIEEALRESQKLFQAIAQNFPNGTINVLDPKLRYIFSDGKELKEFGVKSSQLNGRFFSDTYSRKNKEIIEKNLQGVFNGTPAEFEIEFDDKWYVLNAVPLADQQSIIHHILVVVQNMTRQKKAEIEIQVALEKEKELNELKSRFVSMASHEFRTPLSAILSSVALISRYNAPDDEEKRIKHVSRIKSSVSNLTDILNDLLSIGKLEEGAVQAQPAFFDIKNLSAEIVQEIQSVAKPGQKIHYEHSGESTINSDKNLVRNIIVNLSSNAIKYSSENKPIYISTSVSPSSLSIKIKDEGIGIPEKDQKHLFGRFFRAGNVTNIQGTGLGLNIVKKYLEVLGGRINFTSEMNKGTTFNIEIPLI
jgi:signal transduction histidine kinase